MKRNMVHIDEEKCNGCGLCADACHEGAIVMINGKAKLLSDEYCDGLGACLPACPMDAISIVEREAKPFDEQAVQARQQSIAQRKAVQHAHGGGCPGMAMRQIQRKPEGEVAAPQPAAPEDTQTSQLINWPVQLRLVSPGAPYFQDADLLVAADCTAFALASFHQNLLKGRAVVIACPKLDDNDFNREKLAALFAQAQPKSITVARMEVPCCGGLVQAVREAMLDSRTIVPYREVIVGIEGDMRG